MAPQSTDVFAPLRLVAPDQATVTLLPYGGHITSWTTPDGRERLFLSPRAEFSAGTAIRGGIPIIFPQFAGRGPLRAHGFARILPWTVVNTLVEPSGSATAHLQLSATDATRQIWDYDFRLDLHVTVGGPQLGVSLHVTNTGTWPFEFTAALHTYLAASDSRAVTIEGLQGLTYSEFGREHRQTDSRLQIDGEVDRIYQNVPDTITLKDSNVTVQVMGEGFPDAVVWNPGPQKSAALPDMEPDGYRRMVCIESAAIKQPVSLAPAARWHGAQNLLTGTHVP